MAANLILPFATGVGANVLTDPAWAAYAAIAQGFQAGVAPSNAVNKALRQSTAVASGFGQFAADFSGIDFTDSLSPAQMKANFWTAVAASLDGARMGVDTSTTVNQINITLTPTPPTLNGLKTIWIKPANTNTGPVTVQVAPPSGVTFANLALLRAGGSNVANGDLIAGTWYPTTCDGTAFKLLTPVASDITALTGGLQPGIPGNTIIYNSAGTFSWTCPAGTNRVRVTMWAGGGGGGGTATAASSVASSGGAGEYRRGIFTVSPGTTYAVTVGAGGTLGAGGSSPVSGGMGGTSSFSNLMSAIGGGGGVAANGAIQVSTGAGGTGGSGGTEANPGTGGGVAYAVNAGYVLSQGGAAYLGGAFTATKVASTALTGLDGNAPGGGAQGGILGNPGGTGGVGRVVLEY